MVAHSLSILSPLPSTSSSDSLSYFPKSFNFSRRSPNSSSLFFSPPRASSSSFSIKPPSTFSEDDSASPEKFLQNNSIADFMRFRKRSDGGDGELQTAVVSFRKKFPWSILQPFLKVDLVSTIHIADKEYFANLQKELEPYDCVLYEMVASRESLENRRNTATKRRLKSSRSRGFNVLGFIQRQMARILMLDFQLDCLDYQAENWYHADLDFETFKTLQVERGESFFTFARDMTLKSTKALIQPEIPENLDPWRSKLLWASRVLPMPLVGLLIIGGICTDVGGQVTEYPELDALSRLDFGAAMKVFLAKRLTSEFTQVTADVEEKSVIINDSEISIGKQYISFGESSRSEFGLVSTDSLLNPTQKSAYLGFKSYDTPILEFNARQTQDQYPLRHFMDVWPKDNANRSGIPWSEDLKSDLTRLSMSIPMSKNDFLSSTSDQEKTTVSPLMLSRELAVGDTGVKHNAGIPITWGNSMGGPLGEVLNNTSNVKSALNLMGDGCEWSPRLGSSPTGVLQSSTFVSLSNSSSAGSPTGEN